MIIDAYSLRTFCFFATRPRKIAALFRMIKNRDKLRIMRFVGEDVVAPSPQTIAIIPTYRCNLNCVQCGQWGPAGFLRTGYKDYCDKSKELTTEQLKLFIDQVASFKPYLYFTGGEPLLREDICELIAHASSKGILTSLNSNGTLMAKRSDDIIKSGLDYLYVSLDGTEKKNEKIRCGRVSTKAAIEGICAVLESRKRLKSMLPIIEIRTTVTKDNQDNLLDLAQYVDSHLHADVLGIALPIFTTKRLVEDSESVYRKEFNIDAKCWAGFAGGIEEGIDAGLVEEQISKIKSARWGFRLKFYPDMLPEHIDYGLYLTRPEKLLKDIPFCPVPYFFSSLLPNGDIATCASVPDYIAGSILENDFMDIWNGMRYKIFREYTRKNFFPTCARCVHLYTFSARGL